MSMGEKESKGYSGENIKVLEGLDGVRARPSMYIGSTSKYGLHKLVDEIVDNSVDEAMAGYCTDIDITLNSDGSVTVEDNGRGIPVDSHPVYKIPTVEVVITKLHAGGKFDKGSYKISGGLHGVGISVVAALSKHFKVIIKRDGKIYQQEYEIGKPLYKLKVVGECDKNQTGTSITFTPDDTIFSATKFDFSVLETRFREIAFLNKGVKISLIDKVTNKKEIFKYEGGLLDFVKWVNKTRNPIHTKPVYFIKEQDKVFVECAVQYNDGYQENVLSFVNTINTIEGGTHVIGFKTALTRAINDYGNKNKLLKDGNVTGDDVREGLTVIISVKVPEPQFEGQTKTKLGNSEVKGIVDSVSMLAMAEFFEENPQVARKIVDKALEGQKARAAAKKAKELIRRKNAFSVGGLPGKLADCSSNKTEETELYLVEGDSAGGSAKQARNKEFQAILPLKGKILNVEKAQPVKVLSNEEITNMITATGAGINEQFDISKLRYSKVIIMSVDGQEMSFVQNPYGEIECVKIGEFIDSAIENKTKVSDYNVLCFNLKTRRSQFKPIKAVVKHPIDEALYEIKTSYGRNVKVTSSHSIFIYEDNEIKLKKGNEIKQSDRIVAPKNLPLHNYDYSKKIDVLSLLVRNKKNISGQVYVKGNSIAGLLKHKLFEKHKDNDNLVGERVAIPEILRNNMKAYRKKKKLSGQFICENLEIKQPCIYYDWENGKSKPTLKKFEKYVEILGLNKEQALSQVKVVRSSLDRVFEEQYNNSGRNIVKDYISINQLEEQDLSYIEEDVLIYSEHYSNQALKRYIPVNESLMKLMGFWTAEGSWSVRNGIRLSVGTNDSPLIVELSRAFEEVFGLSAKLSYSKNRQTCGELKLVNKVAALFWKFIFNLDSSASINKKIPSVIFNVSRELQMEFLRTYFLGDGALSKNNISFTTVSKDLANQLLYLLQSFGIMGSLSEREPSINKLIHSKNRVYIVSVNSKKDLLFLRKIWINHRNSLLLQSKINNGHCSINQKFNAISEDLVALQVRSIKEVQCSSRYVYDFSVEEDENFIAGMGGLCCHNTDADVDGAHIRTLLLTFFFRFMRKLIENGNIYIAVSPLYRVRKRGDHYVYSDKELKELISKLGGNVDVQRFKGLGEMNAEQLWDTTMNPKTRMLKKVTIEDGVKADEVFSKLMGDEVEHRKQFIAERASEAQIDI